MTSTLLAHLESSLSTNFPGSHRYTLQLLRSQPRRSHALFPHATNLKTKIWQEELLLILSERSLGTDGKEDDIPVFALEASNYTIPSTSTALLYISKVDTTGLSDSSLSPARTLTSAFLSYQLLHPPHAVNRIRIHIFAKAQGQYLFPGSVENKGKKVLDDKGLIRWWKGCISASAVAVGSGKEGEGKEGLRLFYLIPGLGESEALPYVPLDPRYPPSTVNWTYSHPYSLIPSPLYPSSTAPENPTVNDLIPAFPDDPKSRFLTSLTSSSISASGEPDDYDDVILALASNAFTTGSSNVVRKEAVERARERERGRLIAGVPGGAEEWWERMAFRQECCSGVLVGFFVVVLDREPPTPTSMSNTAPTPQAASLPHPLFTKLWSQFHNVDYATTALANLPTIRKKWSEDLLALVSKDGYRVGTSNGASEGAEGDFLRRFVERRFEVKNEGFLDSGKRERVVEEPIKVNLMVPRKKKKV